MDWRENFDGISSNNQKVLPLEQSLSSLTYEEEIEYYYWLNERLGFQCLGREHKLHELKQANREAIEHIKKLRTENAAP